MINICFMRHSLTDLSGKGIIASKSDTSLNDEGIKLCQENAFSEGSFDMVYSSPTKRCIETAELLYPYKEPVKSSLINQRELGILNEHYRYEYDLTYINQVKDYLNTPIGSESFEDVQKRIHSFIDLVIDENIDNSNILVITHNGIMRVIRKEFIDNSSFQDTPNLKGFNIKVKKI